MSQNNFDMAVYCVLLVFCVVVGSVGWFVGVPF